MKKFSTIAEFTSWRKQISGTVGFVPTMGALHAGHKELLRQMRKDCDQLVLSVFVNPTQFCAAEDFLKYPKTLENDLAIAQIEKVDCVFLPSNEEIYPTSYSTYVEELNLSQPLCGTFRPGHFKGVTTIVLKLFNIIKPTKALFGLKDAQQFFVIQKMVKDLNLDIQVDAIPTVREPDGLALSSRNIYLSNLERERAPFLYKILKEQERTLLNGERITETLRHGIQKLTDASFQVQYFELLKLPLLEKLESLTLPTDQPSMLATAVFLGKTRLIDNVLMG